MSSHIEQSHFIGRFLLDRGIGIDTWKLAEQFGYYDWVLNETFLIPAGFSTDFASIPRFAHVLLPKNGEYDAPAVLHDWLYYAALTNRDTADFIFLEAMEVLGVPKWKRVLLYRAVRDFGWKAWNKHRKQGHSYATRDF